MEKMEDHVGIEYRCFRCGFEEYREDDDGTILRCPDCGEKSLISFLTACDILNDLYLRGQLNINNYENLDD